MTRNAHPRVVAFIQARLGSTRLPGKMLADLAGQPVIDWVVKRVVRTRLVHETVVVTSDNAADNVLVEHLQRYPVKVFRGSEADVLERFVGAAQKYSADVVVRICADNPLTAAEEIDRAIAAFFHSDADYAFNHVPRMGNLYPDGLGAEVIKASVLEQIRTESSELRHREHVTAFVWDHVHRFKIHVVGCPRVLQTAEPIKLDIDTPDDLQRMRQICSGLSDESTAEQIVRRWREMNHHSVL